MERKTAEEIIKQAAELYGRMNSINKLKNDEVREAAVQGYIDGAMNAIKDTTGYNPLSCYGYLKMEWEQQAPKVKEIFGTCDAYTIEQYVNGMLSIIPSLQKQNAELREALDELIELSEDGVKHRIRNGAALVYLHEQKDKIKKAQSILNQ